jgi:outer membrane lipoprotein carrier protein
MRFPACVRAAACALLLGAGVARADEDVAALLAYLDGLDTLRAEFTQERYDEYGAPLETARGTVQIARPGRFRWDYTEPAVQTLVTDGTTLWIYDADLAQVTVSPLTAGGAGTPAELLGAEFAVRDRYAVARLPDAAGLAWYELTPRDPGSEFQAVRLALAGGELAAMRLADNLGQTTLVRFTALTRNGVVPAENFDFVPPPGVDVVEGTTTP